MRIRRKLKRADISIMVAVFCVAFLAFCAFGIDMAYITLNRVKLQRATETTALAAVARYKDDGVDDSENLFRLFKSRFDTIHDANIISSDIKNEGGGVYKISLSTVLMSPTYFLRFAGVGGVRLEAKSYAKTDEYTINNKQYGDIIDLNGIMTDKKGSEFKITTQNNSNGYFVFAGSKNENGVYVWSDVGCKADSGVFEKEIDGKKYSLICSNQAKFDLSKPCSPPINANVVTSIRIFGANPGDCGGGGAIGTTLEEKLKEKLEQEKLKVDEEWKKTFPLKDKDGNEIAWDKLKMPDAPDFPVNMDWLNALIPPTATNPFELVILNDVKLITGSDF